MASTEEDVSAAKRRKPIVFDLVDDEKPAAEDAEAVRDDPPPPPPPNPSDSAKNETAAADCGENPALQSSAKNGTPAKQRPTTGSRRQRLRKQQWNNKQNFPPGGEPIQKSFNGVKKVAAKTAFKPKMPMPSTDGKLLSAVNRRIQERKQGAEQRSRNNVKERLGMSRAAFKQNRGGEQRQQQQQPFERAPAVWKTAFGDFNVRPQPMQPQPQPDRRGFGNPAPSFSGDAFPTMQPPAPPPAPPISRPPSMFNPLLAERPAYKDFQLSAGSFGGGSFQQPQPQPLSRAYEGSGTLAVPTEPRGIDFTRVRDMLPKEMLRYVQKCSHFYADELDSRFPDFRKVMGRMVRTMVPDGRGGMEAGSVVPCDSYNQNSSCRSQEVIHFDENGARRIHSCTICYFSLGGMINLHRQCHCPLLSIAN